MHVAVEPVWWTYYLLVLSGTAVHVVIAIVHDMLACASWWCRSRLNQSGSCTTRFFSLMKWCSCKLQLKQSGANIPFIWFLSGVMAVVHVTFMYHLLVLELVQVAAGSEPMTY